MPAGSSYNNQPADSDPNIVHVDTGGGKFDHHSTADFTCAAMLVYEYLVKEGYISEEDKALPRMMRVIVELDHGWDNYQWPEPDSDRYEFMVHNLLFGRKVLTPNTYEKQVEWGMDVLEAMYVLFKSKVEAEREIEEGQKFETQWGKGVAVFTGNSTVLDLAIKKGYAISLIKDPKKGNVRVTGSNILNVDLTKAYELSRKADPEATWFLHASKVLLRNGSTRNPTMKATKLGIDDMIKILEKA